MRIGRVGFRRRLSAGIAPAVVLVFALAWAPTALAAGTSISGRVVDGTRGGGVAGLGVTLHLLAGQSEVGTKSATTDGTGAFSFTDIGTDATEFVVTATYRGVPYESGRVAIGQTADVTLKVYEPSTSPKDVVQTSWVVWIDRDPAGIAVQQSLTWQNSGKTAYVGGETLPDGRHVVVRLPLAAGASGFQFLGAFLETPGFVQGTSFVHTEPIVPGKTEGTLWYVAKSVSKLSFPVLLPTGTFELYVPTDMKMTSPQLTAAGQTTDNGITYQQFTASDLAVGTTIDVTLSDAAAASTRSPLTLVLIAVAVLAAAGAIALWGLGRSRSRAPVRRRDTRAGSTRVRQPAPTNKPARAASGSNGSGGGQVRAAARTQRVAAARRESPNQESDDELDVDGEDQAALLVDEIAALDLAFERGLLEKRTYERLRAAAKNRLVRLRSARAGGGSGR